MRYLFTESYPVTYSQYRDADTGHVLTAYDGETYELEPVVEGLPVPPQDGRWSVLIESATPGMPPLVAPVPPAAPAVPAPAPAPAPPAPAPADAPADAPETTDGGEG